MRRQPMISLLLMSLIFQSACIHTDSTEHASIEMLELDKLDGKAVEQGTLRIENLIYSSRKLPLEDFFNRMIAGEFKAAFQRINLSYTPATSDDKVLHELLDTGLIPVYVRMGNHDDRSYEFKEKDFTLDDGTHRLKAIPAEQLPRVLESYNIKALGANIYNTGAVVLAVTGIMVVMAIALKSPNGSIPSDFGDFSGSDEYVYNETTKKTYLDYKNYLLTTQTIRPGEKAQGLLFFKAGKGFDKDDSHLVFKGISQSKASP